MFVKRKPSRIPPGRKNRQIYIPHKQMQIVQPPLEIRTKADALFYYNELKRLGYIAPPTPPSPNNAIYATLGASDNTYVQFSQEENNDNIIFTGADLEADAIIPAPLPGQEYDIQLLGCTVAYMSTIDGNQHDYWLSNMQYNNGQITTNNYQNSSANILLPNIGQVMYYDMQIGQNNVKCIFMMDRLGDIMYIFRTDQWRIDLSPAQTLINILMVPVNE